VSLKVSKAAKGELVFTSSLFLAAVVILFDTTGLRQAEGFAVIGPQLFAYIVGGSLLLLSTWQIIQVLRGNLGKPEEIEGGDFKSTPNWKALGLVLAGLLFYAFLVEIIGFMLCAAVLFYLVASALGEKRRIRLIFISIAIAVVVYFGFTAGLQISLPFGFEFIPGNEPVVEEW
jgi:putative tricarboxylic transport membrane protein